MALWDSAAIELIGEGFIELREGGTGTFRFIAVEGHMDCRFEERDELPLVSFSWDGHDDGMPVSGRGWLRPVENGEIEGHIYFHLGDDSSFQASR